MVMKMKFSKIVIGGMRFKNKQNAAEIINKAVECGFNYIDVSPCYCYENENSNSEVWIGDALKEYNINDKIIVSAKCSVGNGGVGLGEFRPQSGFGVMTKQQLKQVFDQSLKRMNLQKFDWYHLWTTHTQEQLSAAFKPGGWLDGVMEYHDKWSHLGITTHAESDMIIKFVDTGKFEAITMPFNVINTTRLKGLEYCKNKGVKVIAMNPFAGGFLAQNNKLKEYALRYLLKMNIHPLIGFSSIEEVEYAKWVLDTMDDYPLSPQDILDKVATMLNSNEPRCTACGYCSPCPQGINVGAVLSYYNLYKYMKMPEAKSAFREKQWEEGLRLDKCTQCGLCETRCPNNLDVLSIIKDARKMMYDD
jgi:predicted aldo/keto reductase-like oxidoreductase